MTLLKIYTNSPQKTINFYHKVFDWDISKWHGPGNVWFIRDKTSYIGALIKPEEHTKGYFDPNFISTIEVEDYESIFKKIILSGGRQLTPKTDIPGVGTIGKFLDSQGVSFDLIQTA